MNKNKNLRNAPLTDFEKARIMWFENYGSAIVDKSRYFVMVVLMALCVVALCIALAMLTPLKTVKPYVINVHDTGAVTVNPMAAQPYQPGQAEQKYFLSQWTIKMLTLDPYLTEKYLSEAYTFTTGKASDEFRSWIDTTKPIATIKGDPYLTRTVKINDISFNAGDNVAFIDADTETRHGTDNPQVDHLRLTIEFVVTPPETEADILHNPIGMYVTHFNIDHIEVPDAAAASSSSGQ